MDLEEAKTLLNGATRHESRDHAFGDVEVFWVVGSLKKEGDVLKEIATGYFNGAISDVTITLPNTDAVSFFGEDALALRECGTQGAVGRNDSTGPDAFVEGQIVPGLTLDGVRDELTS